MSRTAVKPAGAAPTTTHERAKFFSLGAEYVIEPGADLNALLNDFRCLFSSGMGAIQADAESFDCAQWAGVYCLRQAGAVFDAIDGLARQAIRTQCAAEAVAPAQGQEGGAA